MMTIFAIQEGLFEHERPVHCTALPMSPWTSTRLASGPSHTFDRTFRRAATHLHEVASGDGLADVGVVVARLEV